MATYHVNNKPYWYDSTGTISGLFYFDTDLGTLSGLSSFSGLWSAPNSNNYYNGMDRITDLNNATYKPNNPYGYGNAYMTGSYATTLADDCIISNNYDYATIRDDLIELNSRYGVAMTNVVFVPISVLISRNPTAQREYYIELHIKPNHGSSTSTGSYYDFNIAWKIRSHDLEIGTDTYIADWLGVSGWRIYNTFTPNYTVRPVFSYWYNGDSDNPKIVYQFGAWRRASNSQVSTLNFATGNSITNNGHTFYPLSFSGGIIDNGAFTYWDSEAYEYYNPTNPVAFDQLIEEMGPYGPESKSDGYPEEAEPGHGDDSSDTIAIPDDPLIGISNVGFVNVYKTGINSLQNIGVELFPDLQYTNPTPISGSSDVIESIENGFNSIITALANIPSIISQQVAATLINYIIDCHVIPVTPSGGTTENIKVGYKTLTATGDRLSSDYETFDCGTIKLGEYYGSFADFMTSSKLFLPFVGFVPARTEWFYADTLGVKYKFNIIDGSFQAYVTSTGKYVNNNGSSGTVIAQYSGNACVHLPITGVTYASMVSGLVGAGAGAITSAGSGNIAGVASSVVNAAGATGDIPQSNSYSSSAAFLSIRRPFLMIERPVTNYSPSFRKERGLPSNITKKLSSIHGFAILNNIHLDSVTATDEEKKELETLFNNGVIF